MHFWRVLFPIRIRRPLALLLVSACASACGGSDDPAPDDSPGPNEEPSLGAVEQKLAACALVATTSDPTASACIEGTYTGKTLSDGDCSLTIGNVGAYTFTSPTLSVTSTPQGNSIFVFDHTSFGGFGMVTWKVSDPLSSDTWDELDFTAQYGEAAPAANRKLDIEVTRHTADATTAVKCVVTF